MTDLVPIERIENRIFIIRGQKVMIDRDLAELYGVENYQLKRQVKRNIGRFPNDFMFILNNEEIGELVCQIGIPARSNFGGSKPFAFTEHGILMLSSVLNSERAIQVNILIMRVFARSKQIFAAHKELAQKLKDLERQVGSNVKDIRNIFQAINRLMRREPGEGIGFKP